MQVIELPDFQLFAYVEDGCRIVEIEDGIGMIIFIIVRRIFAVSRDEVVDPLADRSVPAGALAGLGLSCFQASCTEFDIFTYCIIGPDFFGFV